MGDGKLFDRGRWVYSALGFYFLFFIFLEARMKTVLLPEHYFDQKIYDHEQAYIFKNTWQFVAFWSELENDGDYLTVEIAGCSVVIKNFQGVLKAFRNICLHRFSQICEGRGNGLLKCPYHGWTYDQTGRPYAIPGKKEFESSAIENLKLKEYALASIGPFVFVNLGLELNSEFCAATHLRKNLGDFVKDIEQFGHILGNKIDTNILEIEANWKVCVENTLESYHVFQVHPKSFYTLGIISNQPEMHGLHSKDFMMLQADLSSNQKLKEILDARPVKLEGYQHMLCFPNMTLASAFGMSVSIQQIIPQGPNKTCFISHVFATKIDSLNLNAALVKAFNYSVVDFNRRVFKEDQQVCESVQRGLKELGREKLSSPLSQKEARLDHFQRAYQNMMLGNLNQSLTKEVKEVKEVKKVLEEI